MKSQSSLMHWQMFACYIAAMIITSFVTAIDLHLMKTMTWPTIVVHDIIIMLLLLGYTRWRLPVFNQVKHAGHHAMTVDTRIEKERHSYRLLRLPNELFAIVMLISIMTTLYQMLVWQSLDAGASTDASKHSFIVLFSFEFGRAFLIAILIWILTKMILRPYILRLHILNIQFSRRTSVSRSIVFVYAVCLAISSMAAARMTALSIMERHIDYVQYTTIVGMYTLLSVSIILIHTMYWKRNLHMVTQQLQRLDGSSKNITLQTLPVCSFDEIGSLVMAINNVQVQLDQQVQELAKQLAMARDIQQRLLPEMMPAAGPVRIAAYCEACYEVGGDFYDVIRVNETKLLVAIGDVSGKGMSAAILMSVMLAALRAEASRGNTSPGQLLTQLNKQMYAITKGKQYVTIGVVVLEMSISEDTNEASSTSAHEAPVPVHCSYASAGHMAPYITADGQLFEIEQSALPLGIAFEEDYISKEQRFTLARGQTLVMYSDGVIETPMEGETLFGFERWETELRQLDQQNEPAQALHQLLERLPHSMDQHLRWDDRTIVLVRHVEG